MEASPHGELAQLQWPLPPPAPPARGAVIDPAAASLAPPASSSAALLLPDAMVGGAAASTSYAIDASGAAFPAGMSAQGLSAGASLDNVIVDWSSRQVMPKSEQLSPPGLPASRSPLILSSSLLRFPDLSFPLPHDLRSQQIFGAGAGSRDHGRPFSHQVMMNSRSLRVELLNAELPNFAKLTPQEMLDAKALAASKSHSEAERRRRERINTHLATLRSLLPSSTKTDKASLLAEVIDHVKDLKRQAAEIAEGGPVPTDVDEIRVDPDPSYGKDSLVIKASLCCDDRPDLLSDLIRALSTLRLKTFRAEIATLGGRVKNVFLMTRREEGNEETEESFSVTSVQEALKAVLERAGSVDFLPENSGSSKRQRLAQFDASSSAHAPDQRSY